MTLAVILAFGYGIKKMNSDTGNEQLLNKNNKTKKKSSSGQVDREFVRRVFELVKKLVPSWKCREAGQTLILSVLLVVRTWMSIWLADVNGRVVKAIINKDLAMFIRRVSSIQVKSEKFCVDFYFVPFCPAIVNSEFWY